MKVRKDFAAAAKGFKPARVSFADRLIEKYDYRNKDADWKTSKDAVQRGMQKLKGGFPADAPYRMKK